MRQTLFYLPHQLGPLTLFGWVSWGMLGLMVYVALILLMSRTREARAQALRESGFAWAIGAAVIGALLPMVESKVSISPTESVPIGLPIRGYGLMLMLGVLAAVWIASRRMVRLGLSRDSFLSLALWVVIGGLLGARLFYVVQKWSELDGQTIQQKIWTALQFTEGGLVVYGSVMGGMVGILLWTVQQRVRPIPLFDAVVPAFFIGLSLGRIGCLLNGCCYGGICDSDLPCITFPKGAPAYMDQLEHGRLLGMDLQAAPSGSGSVIAVDAASWAANQQIEKGQRLDELKVFVIPPDPKDPMRSALAPPEFEGIMRVNDRNLRFSDTELPARSLPVHPSQIYASISALLLCFWSLAIPHWIERPGRVFGAGLIGYGVVRILEEIIRVDEQGQFGTSLSISQWVSVVGILAGIAILVASVLRVFQPQTTSGTASGT